MSDIREAFEALNKYRKAYDEMYQMLGIFLDADEGLEKPDIDEAWAAFNLAPGPVYWKAIEAALSANGEPMGMIPVDEQKPAMGVPVIGFSPDWVDPDFNARGLRECFTFGDAANPSWHSAKWRDEQDCYTTGEDAPTYWSPMLTNTHPAPPSVAVPEGKRVARWVKRALRLMRTMGVHSGWHEEASEGEEILAMLTAAPSPDHSGDANKMVDVECCCGETEDARRLCPSHGPNHIADAGKVAFVDGVGAQRMLAEECKEGIGYIIHGDNIYWPLSDDDELRFIQAACGNGEFTYPGATPSVPENEVKAKGVEELTRLLAEHFCRRSQSEFDGHTVAEHIEHEGYALSTRLRTAGDDGE